jgi:RHS repeat-associated protein
LASVAAPGNVNLGYGYDGFLLTDLTWSGALSASYHRKFDSSLRIASDSINGGNLIAYGYDADDLPTSAGSETLTRDPMNGRITATSLGGLSDATTYDPFGAIQTYAASSSGALLYGLDYGTRDALGRVTSKTETVQGTTTTTLYDYDKEGRLWHVTVNGALAATYAYDANDNRISVVTPGSSLSPTFDDQDRMLTYGGATYTYGANGELATKTIGGVATKYVYDALGNLVEVDLPTKTITYIVDGQGRRVAKLVNGAVSKAWAYKDALAPIAELDASGNVTSRFVYGAMPRTVDQIVQGTTTYRVLSDALGSVRLVVDSATGQLAQRIDYDAWGNVNLDTQPGFQPFGFAGAIYDADTGLMHFGARDYDPAAGRWTAKDPLRFYGGMNLYSYALNDPVNLIDALGTDPQQEWVFYCFFFGCGGPPDYVPAWHSRRNQYNFCPTRVPSECACSTTCAGPTNDFVWVPNGGEEWSQDSDWLSWALGHAGVDKWRSTEGDECIYDSNGDLVLGGETYNYGPNPSYPDHWLLDYAAHYAFSEESGYVPNLTTRMPCWCQK